MRCEPAGTSMLDHCVHRLLLLLQVAREGGGRVPGGTARCAREREDFLPTPAVSPRGVQGRDGGGEGLSCAPSRGHKNWSFLQGAEGGSAGLPAARGCREGREDVAGTLSPGLAAVQHQLRCLSPRVPRGHCCLHSPHICSESRIHSFHQSSFIKYF